MFRRLRFNRQRYRHEVLPHYCDKKCCSFAEGQPVNEKQLLKAGEEARIREMQRRMQEMEDTITCSICLDRVRSVAFLCGHGACAPCAQTLKVCHMCRKQITSKINLFT